ncbi:DUF2062 domain-containing protein [Aquibium sp. A9E412]|uniref:DUF2062 domain-containing protein n=1 Tax=Aquibium sp. A9E412 TaxID=2976767 RepID=UPI0025B24CA5|nr:DUF2062 domain-containing protein [Aquibium sp. A9E412]MDN2567145.1 DUF2062 domain-containing protein [Aquibium sp. A9E412]
MLFKRRRPADFWERMRTFLWPRRSFWRSAQYFAKRVLRLRATPHAIAAGVAAGAFASFTPFLGFHFLIAALLAWVLGGNLLASAFGTAVGNPLTFPLIWGATYECGKLILHGGPSGEVPLHIGRRLRDFEFAQLWQPLLKPMTVGAIPLGLTVGIVFYFLTRWALVAFREQRRRRLAERARRRAAAQAYGAKTAAG